LPEKIQNTTQGGYVKSLDGLRCLAVTLVLLDHWTNYNMGFPVSYFGVSLFFVLSGFLITGILLKAKKQDISHKISHGRSLKLFYIRRTIRIFPIYYLVIFVLLLVNEENIRKHLIWLISYQTNNYIAFTDSWMGSYDHFWSLAVEEQFYLFFPFVIFFINNKNIPKVLIGLIIFSVLLRLWFFVNHYSWIRPFVLMPTSLDALGLGSMLAYFYHEKPDLIQSISPQKLKNGLLLSFLLFVVVIILVKTPAEPHNFSSVVLLRFFESLFSVFLIFSFVKIDDNSLFTSTKKWLFENSVVVFIGKISYGIYIYHHFVYNFYYSKNTNISVKIFQKLNHLFAGLGDHILVKLCVLFPITIAISAVSWYLFEKPINNLKDRFKY
jgi:peptidoglycan/LPS O-acetylase OafA/YrhL